MAQPAMQPRMYQYEALEKAREQNTILRMDTGTGKTLVDTMLIRHVTSTPVLTVEPRKLIVFLSPGVDLVRQQARTIQQQTNLRVKSFVGDDVRRSANDKPDSEPLPLKFQFWEREVWMEEFKEADVIVCTPQIWLNGLDHAYWDLTRVSLLIFDEAHHTRWRRFANSMSLHYHPAKASGKSLPRILGMTASPVWKPEKVLKAIQELETNLDATLFEIKVHQSDVLKATPRPKEQCVEYDEAPKLKTTAFEQELLDLQPELEWDDKTWSRIAITKQDLGTLGCDIFLSHLLSDHLHHATQSLFNSPLSPSLTSLNTRLLSFVTAEPLTNQNSTPHLRALIDVLVGFRDRPHFHAMVFVKQRNHARVLVDLLHKSKELQGWVRADWLVGHGGKEEEGRGHGMDVKEQEKKVARFRKSETNVLLATSVAEEGLDFPTCSVVVRFNAVQTMTSYIQSRGRARADDSYLYILAQRDSLDVVMYSKFVDGEKGLTDLYGEHESVEVSADDFLDLGLDVYTVDSGAKLFHQRAISLLSEACSLLPTDAFAPVQQPKYTITGSGRTWNAKVQLPMIVCMGTQRVFHSATSTGTISTKAAAKQSAAFQACKALHQAGGLDEYLLPPRGTTRGAGGRDADGDRVDTTKVPESLTSRTPNLFGNIRNPDTPLFLLTVEVFDGDETLSIGLVAASPLVDFFGGKLFPADPDRELVVRVASRELLEIRGEERRDFLAKLDDFNRTVLRLVVNIKLMAEPLDILWAPLLPAGKGIDWDGVANVLVPIPPTGSPSGSHVWIPCRRVRTSAATFVQVRADVTTHSSARDVDPEPRRKHVRSFKKADTYLQAAEWIYLHHDPTPTIPDAVFQLRTLSNEVPNLLSRTPPRIPSTYHTPRLVNYPSKMCRTSPLPASFFQLMRQTPSLTRLLHDTVHAQAIINEFELPQIDIPLLIEALTAPSAMLGFDYQYLETLGDSVLKLLTTLHIYIENPTLDEGRMGPLRANSVSNQFFRTRSLKIGFNKAILSELFRTRSWVPSTSHDAKLVDDGTTVERQIKRRWLSDTMEGALGAAYATGGIKMALETGDKLGLCFGGTTPWGERPSSRKGVKSDFGSPAGLRCIEEKLGYTFKDVRLLQQALTHRSATGAETYCYEREEHLGDGKASFSVLDFWATIRLYELFPHSTPRVLTYLRALLVNNATLAYLSVHVLSLHRSTLHGSASLDLAIKVAVAQVESSNADAEADSDSDAEGATAAFSMARIVDDLSWSWDPPKILGDIFEAVLGSIVVDDGFRLETVFGVLDQVYAEIMPHLQAIERRDPVSKLVMFYQLRHCVGIKIKVIPTKDPKSTLPEYQATSTFHSDTVLATCTSSSKAVARQLAARATLAYFEKPGGEALFDKCTCTPEETGTNVKLSGKKEEDEDDEPESEEVPPAGPSVASLFEEEEEKSEEDDGAGEFVTTRVREY
ncbi:hypothetical protein RQP46_003405 [Phenoliferia psychrophenolica]